MKILLTGGGTGGHFYPIIAVSEELRELQKEKGILNMELYFTSTDPYNEEELNNNDIKFKKVFAGKVRTYNSPLRNIVDAIITFLGALHALFMVFFIFPDVVFGKGGFSSFPALFAAKILGIPVIIHESDTVPGRVNKWAGKFAKKIAVSFEESLDLFPKEKTALIGRPIKKEIAKLDKTGAKEFLHIKDDLPVIFILGGSQGSQKINEVVIDSLPELTKNFYIIHQTGKENFLAVNKTGQEILKDSDNIDKFKPFPYLDTKGMRMAASISDLIISRSGSTLFEIAAWGKPSILIPFPYAHGNHQHQNAFAYAKIGACSVIEEDNLTTSVLVSEINKILNSKEEKKRMSEAALSFHNPDASKLIAQEIIKIAISHG